MRHCLDKNDLLVEDFLSYLHWSGKTHSECGYTILQVRVLACGRAEKGSCSVSVQSLTLSLLLTMDATRIAATSSRLFFSRVMGYDLELWARITPFASQLLLLCEFCHSNRNKLGEKVKEARTRRCSFFIAYGKQPESHKNLGPKSTRNSILPTIWMSSEAD